MAARLEAASKQVIHSEERASDAVTIRVAVHELNQPLTALMGTVELLEMRSDLPAGVCGKLTRMYDQLDRMAEIVRGLGGGIQAQESS